MTRPDPLDRFAPRPASAEDVTAEGMMRASLVRARAALALWEAGHDAARQLAYVTGHYATAKLLREILYLEQAEIVTPQWLDRVVRSLWTDLAAGDAVAGSVDTHLVMANIDPEEVARAAVKAYEARAAEVGAR